MIGRACATLGLCALLGGGCFDYGRLSERFDAAGKAPVFYAPFDQPFTASSDGGSHAVFDMPLYNFSAMDSWFDLGSAAMYDENQRFAPSSAGSEKLVLPAPAGDNKKTYLAWNTPSLPTSVLTAWYKVDAKTNNIFLGNLFMEGDKSTDPKNSARIGIDPARTIVFTLPGTAGQDPHSTNLPWPTTSDWVCTEIDVSDYNSGVANFRFVVTANGSADIVVSIPGAYAPGPVTQARVGAAQRTTDAGDEVQMWVDEASYGRDGPHCPSGAN
jgi:hypothetical protein